MEEGWRDDRVRASMLLDVAGEVVGGQGLPGRIDSTVPAVWGQSVSYLRAISWRLRPVIPSVGFV